MAPCRGTHDEGHGSSGARNTDAPLSRESETIIAALVWGCQPLHRSLWGCEAECQYCTGCDRNWQKVSALCLSPQGGGHRENRLSGINLRILCPVIDSSEVRAVLRDGQGGRLFDADFPWALLQAECATSGEQIVRSLAGLCRALAKQFGLDSDELYSYFLEERMLKQVWANEATPARAQARALKAEASALEARLAEARAAGEPVSDEAVKLAADAVAAAEEARKQAGDARKGWRAVTTAMRQATAERVTVGILIRGRQPASPSLHAARDRYVELRDVAEGLYVAHFRALLEALKSIAYSAELLEKAGLNLPGNTTANAALCWAASVEDALGLYDTWRDARSDPENSGPALYAARLKAMQSETRLAAAREDIARRICDDLQARASSGTAGSWRLANDLKIAQDELRKRESLHMQARLELACLTAVGGPKKRPVPDASLPFWVNSGVYGPVHSWLCRAPKFAERSLGDWLRFGMYKAAYSLAEQKARPKPDETDSGGPGDDGDGPAVLDHAIADRSLNDLADCVGPRQALRDLQKYRSALRQSERDALDAYYGGSSVPPNPQHLRSARRKIATWSSRDLFISCVLTDAEFDGRLVLRRINGLGSDRTIPEIERLVELQSQFAKLLRTDSFTVNDRMAAVLGRALSESDAEDWRSGLYTDSDEMNQAVAAIHEWFYGPSCLSFASEAGAAEAIEGLAHYVSTLGDPLDQSLIGFLCAGSTQRGSMCDGLVGDSLGRLTVWIGRDMMLRRCEMLPELCALGVGVGKNSLDEILEFAQVVSDGSISKLTSEFSLPRQDARFLRKQRVAFLETATALSALFPADGGRDALPVYGRFPELVDGKDLVYRSGSFGVPDHALAILTMAGRIPGNDMWREVSRLDPTQQRAAIDWLRCQLL